MKEKLKILIANDDGIRSEGIAHLAKMAAEFGDVWVAAPERQCSGMSVRLTISAKAEMAVYRYDFPVEVQAAWSVDGTPADCVKVALRSLLPFRPDVVLSGINDGMNAGLDVCYSGTVGAATEAAMHGLPAIAFSMRDDQSFDVTEISARHSGRASAKAASRGAALERELPHLHIRGLPRHSVRPLPGEKIVLRKLLYLRPRGKRRAVPQPGLARHPARRGHGGNRHPRAAWQLHFHRRGTLRGVLKRPSVLYDRRLAVPKAK